MSDDTWSQDWSHGGAQLKTSLSTGHSGYAAIYYNMALLAALHYRQDRADSQGSAANGQWDILLCKCTRLWSCQSCAATTANYIQVTWLVDTLVRSATARGVPWQVLLQHSITLQCYLWVSLLRCERYSFFLVAECGIVPFLCAVHVFDIWASSSAPRLPLYGTKFCFFRGVHCWASPRKKSPTQSVNHSLSHSIT